MDLAKFKLIAFSQLVTLNVIGDNFVFQRKPETEWIGAFGMKVSLDEVVLLLPFYEQEILSIDAFIEVIILIVD